MTQSRRTNPQPPAGLVEAFRAYETALAADDRTALDGLFAPGDTTLRGDADGLVVGHEAIRRRHARGPAAPRRLVQTHVQTIDDDHALVVAVTEPATGGRGQQTQLWARFADGWRITAAHVSTPAPALDARTWRVVGDPLLPSTDPDGALSGETVAVEDVYAVAGQRIGAGNPEWLRHAPVEDEHARAVRRLLDAGAELRGIARTGELGGSGSGPATAVGLGHASIGLGVDTGRSVRVPAASEGLFGIRATHGVVPTEGLLPLAPGLDSVGWLTRSAFLLQAVGDVLLPEQPTGGNEVLVAVPGLLDLAEPDVATTVKTWLPRLTREEEWPLAPLSDWLSALLAHRARQTWEAHGDWLAPRLDTLGADVRGRLERAAALTSEQAEAVAATVVEARARIRELVGDRILVLPTAAGVRPATGGDPGAGPVPVRDATSLLTCVAALGGLPAVTLPLRTPRGERTGVSLVAAAGRDRDLLDISTRFAEPAPRS